MLVMEKSLNFSAQFLCEPCQRSRKKSMCLINNKLKLTTNHRIIFRTF